MFRFLDFLINFFYFFFFFGGGGFRRVGTETGKVLVLVRLHVRRRRRRVFHDFLTVVLRRKQVSVVRLLRRHLNLKLGNFRTCLGGFVQRLGRLLLGDARFVHRRRLLLHEIAEIVAHCRRLALLLVFRALRFLAHLHRARGVFARDVSCLILRSLRQGGHPPSPIEVLADDFDARRLEFVGRNGCWIGLLRSFHGFTRRLLLRRWFIVFDIDITFFFFGDVSFHFFVDFFLRLLRG